jgi:hypothetical protein
MVLRLMSSLCKPEHIDGLLTDKFQVLLKNMFNVNCDALQEFNKNQLAIFKNLVDTIMNIWYECFSENMFSLQDD